MLRLQTTVVLPSLGLALVSTSTRGRSPFLRENRIDVSVVRNDSASSDCLLTQRDHLDARVERRRRSTRRRRAARGRTTAAAFLPFAVVEQLADRHHAELRQAEVVGHVAGILKRAIGPLAEHGERRRRARMPNSSPTVARCCTSGLYGARRASRRRRRRGCCWRGARRRCSLP